MRLDPEIGVTIRLNLLTVADWGASPPQPLGDLTERSKMSEDHKKMRAAQVSKALEILETDGDAAMDNYLFPLGFGWVKYYANRLQDSLNALKAYQKAVEDDRVFNVKINPSSEAYRTHYPFVGMVHAARQIIEFSSDLNNLFREHLNYDFTDSETERAEEVAWHQQELRIRKEQQ